MHHKAIANNDLETERKIRYTTDPIDVKRIGTAIDIKDMNSWNNIKGELMLDILRAKFTQNLKMKDDLLATGNKTLGQTGKDRFF